MVLMTINEEYEIRSTDLVFILGAGSSAEAGIPVSSKMISNVEKNLSNEKSEWTNFLSLYNYLKSSILYSRGIFGDFDKSNFNIEQLLIIISILKHKDRNPIYPFIGTWDLRLIDLAGKDFSNLLEFEKLIRKELITWVSPRQYEPANYFSGFESLKNEINQTLKVFTLNYDLCFEKVIGEDNIETGFGDGNEWHYSNFNEESNPKDFFLYKLHGSINWYLDSDTNRLCKNENIETEKPQLIFGQEHKLQSTDPYFFYSSELRKSTLDCKIITCIGYSFEDTYINGILAQSLISNKDIVLLNVNDDGNFTPDNLAVKLNLEQNNQIKIVKNKAREFMGSKMNKAFFVEQMNQAVF